MLDIVIPLLKNGSKHNDIELQYALRSIEKHVIDYRDIYVCAGYQPAWLKNVKMIYVEDRLTKTKNILNCIRTAFNDSGITDEIFFTNDDIFFLQGINATNYPYYYSISAEQFIADRPDYDIYKRIMIETDLVLCQSGQEDFKYFDIHCPIRYKKDLFEQIIDSYDWNNKYGYIIKSLYGNNLQEKFVNIDDCVVNSPLKREEILDKIKLSHVFSIHSKAINNDMLNVLNELYPQKSKYEK